MYQQQPNFLVTGMAQAMMQPMMMPQQPMM
jgi:hypothetical protein